MNISMPTMVTPQDHQRSYMNTDQAFMAQPNLPPLERPLQAHGPPHPGSVDTEEEMDVSVDDFWFP